MGRQKPLRLNFPIFSIIPHKDYLIVSGGAGSQYGIDNKLAIYKKAASLKDPILEFATKKDLIENLSSNEKTDLISCSSGRNCIIYKLDIAKGQVEEGTRFVTDKDGQNTSIFDSKGETLVTAGEEGVIMTWKITTNGSQITATKTHDLVGHTGSVNHLNISSDDHLLCSSSDDKTCRIFDLQTGSLLKRLTFGEENKTANLKFACAYFSRTHSHLFTIQNSERNGPAFFTVWNIEDGFQPEKTTKLHKMAITSSCLNDEGTYMGLGTVDGRSKIFNIQKMDVNCEVEAHDLIVKSVALVDNSKYLCSVSADYSYFFLQNKRSSGFFSILLRLWVYVIIVAALTLFLNKKYKFF